MNNIIDNIKSFKSNIVQEISDKDIILFHLENNPKCFTRESTTAHITTAAWVVNKTWDKVLMVYHNIYKSYSWTGGHADGDKNLLNVAIKEVEEETGLSKLKIISEKPISLEILTVDGHIKRGSYVSSHLHLNISYLFEADAQDKLRVKPDENSDVKWLPLDSLDKYVNEKWMLENIYNKLIKRCAEIRRNYERPCI